LEDERKMWDVKKIALGASAFTLALLAYFLWRKPECVFPYDCLKKHGEPEPGYVWACVDGKCVQKLITGWFYGYVYRKCTGPGNTPPCTPLRDCVVKIAGKETVTNAAGYYYIGDIPPRVYEAEYIAYGMSVIVPNIKIEAYKGTMINIIIEPPGVKAGRALPHLRFT
jgi:hypothetical protein